MRTTLIAAAFLPGWTLSYRCVVDGHLQPKLLLLSLIWKAFYFLQVCAIYEVEANRREAHLDALINLKNYEAVPVAEIQFCFL